MSLWRPADSTGVPHGLSGDRRRAVVLAVLACAFLGRVAGQLAVVLAAPGWLPPMAEWYSGLLPYPWLLPTQVAILVLQARVSRDLWRGQGLLARRHPRFGGWLRAFSVAYFGVMALRYVVTMALFPERRWLGGAIPIVFHWVLALYLFIWSGFHRQSSGAA